MTTYGKAAYQAWTPQAEQKWTQFAKASLFQSDSAFAPDAGQENLARQIDPNELPWDLKAYDYAKTLVIVDQPGADSVLTGLQLYLGSGLRPIPLFNVVTSPNPQFPDAVQTEGIVAALALGTYVVSRPTAHGAVSNPVFLLDYNRDDDRTQPTTVYDNRWNVAETDLPTAAYLKQNGIDKVLLISQGLVHDDIAHILSDYTDAGITVEVYSAGQFTAFTPLISRGTQLVSTPTLLGINNGTESSEVEPPPVTHLARRYTWQVRLMRWVLGALALLSVVNLMSQWSVLQPAWWTAPALQWTVYGPIPEPVGDWFAVLFTLIPVALFLAMLFGPSLFLHKDEALNQARVRKIMTFALGYYALDFLTMILTVAIWDIRHGFLAFMEDPLYGAIAFLFPIIALTMLASAWHSYRHLKTHNPAAGWYRFEDDPHEQIYWDGTVWTDRMRYNDQGNWSYYRFSRTYGGGARFRGHAHYQRFYGYSGYGNTGRGGYSGTRYTSGGG